MAVPTTDTEVTYPAGALTSEGTVVSVEPAGDDRWAVFLDRTAAHPVDTAWPDQPADRVTLRTPDTAHEVAEVRWLPLADAPRLLAYPGERDMAARAIDFLDVL